MIRVTIFVALMFIPPSLPQTQSPKTKTPAPEAKVLEVFTEDKLVLLNFGENEGTKKGEHLLIYRAEPSRRSVTVVTIITVEEMYSLARLDRSSPVVHVGDHVSKRLQGDEKKPARGYGDLIWDGR